MLIRESAVTPRARATSSRRSVLVAGYALLALCFFAAGFLLPPMLEDTTAPALGLERIKLPRPHPVEAFSLEDIGGNGDAAVYTRERLLNQWTLMYFGYTHCPDGCRPNLAVLAEVARRLRGSGGRATGVASLEAVFVSLDPSRDTPAAIRAFLAAAGAPIVGLRGSEKQIASLARQLGILHLPRPADDGGGYLIDHPATILLIDPSAHLRAGFSMPRDADQIAELSLEIAADYQAAQ